MPMPSAIKAEPVEEPETSIGQALESVMDEELLQHYEDADKEMHKDDDSMAGWNVVSSADFAGLG